MSGMKPANKSGVLACALLLLARRRYRRSNRRSSSPYDRRTRPELASSRRQLRLDPAEVRRMAQGQDQGVPGTRADLRQRGAGLPDLRLGDIRQLRTANIVEIGMIDAQVHSGRFMVTPTEVRDMNDPGRSWPRQSTAGTDACRQERALLLVRRHFAQRSPCAVETSRKWTSTITRTYSGVLPIPGCCWTTRGTTARRAMRSIGRLASLRATGHLADESPLHRVARRRVLLRSAYRTSGTA